ncbi:MAG: peptide deformylase [Gammaproteobacteria bacterium]|nr:peptide deformylase [Gammaproteobacteria bacterium]
MTTQKILRIGNPLLRQKSRPVDDPSSHESQQLLEDMLHSMRHASGAGLAAPQIGQLKRVIVFGIEHNPRYPDAPPVPLTVLFNPDYEVLDYNLESAWEGCLSVPGMRGRVNRPRKIRYHGVDGRGKLLTRDAEGFHARVFMHEFDHLEGILYVDKLADPADFGLIEELEQAGRIPKISADD